LSPTRVTTKNRKSFFINGLRFLFLIFAQRLHNRTNVE